MVNLSQDFPNWLVAEHGYPATGAQVVAGTGVARDLSLNVCKLLVNDVTNLLSLITRHHGPAPLFN